MNIDYWLEVLKISISAIVAIIVVFLGRYFERQKEIDSKIREKKIAIYENFIIGSMDFMLNSSKPNSVGKNNELITKLDKTLRDFNKNLLFWGSDSIIREYIKFQQKTHIASGDGIKIMNSYAKLIRALRKDTGHKNKGLKNSDFMKLFIKAEEHGDVEKQIK